MSQSLYYASLDYIKEVLSTTITPGTTLGTEDKRLLERCRLVSRRIDNNFASQRPLFQPYKETRKITVSPYRINRVLGTLDLGAYLLALDGTISVNGTDVTSVEVYPDSTMPPFRTLRLTDDALDWYSYCNGTDATTPLQVSVPGIWGFHRDYANAWLAVDALGATINAGATTLTVADADGADAYGMTPRLSPGDLIRIDNDTGTAEYMEIVSINATTNTLIVRRGVNGTTADGHSETATVYRWQVEDPVRYAVARQAALAYARRGAFNTVEAGGAAGMIEVRFPSDWLHEVLSMMSEYA